MRGETLGSYRVIDELGKGGMGAVYLAEHTLIGRKAAVKVLLPELSQKPDIVTRFFNEARASTAIAHPGIIQIFDFGYHDSGSAYIVMELLSGESLDDRLARERKLSEDAAVRITRQCASALAAAHEAGIIHRDLKPGNIYITEDPEIEGGERAKILDFGIAKLTDAGDDGEFKTRTGSMMGTPVYMSPEQCRGAGEVDHRSDIYSLACVLFRMVCGQPPFVAQGFGEIIAAHLYQPPPSPRSFEPSLSPQLEGVMQRALAKSPDERFASMFELADALRALRRASSVYPGGPAPETGTGTLGWPQQAPAPGLPQTLPGPQNTGRDSHPSGALPAPPTTLGAAASQQLAVPQTGRRKRVLLATLGAAALAVGLGAALVLCGGGTPQVTAGGAGDDGAREGGAAGPAADPPVTTPTPTAAAAEPGLAAQGAAEVTPETEAEADPAVVEPEEPDAAVPVITTIESSPSGAAVFRRGEDELLGRTPYQHIALPEPGEITLELKLHGHHSKEVSFAGDQDDTVHVELERRPSRSRKRRKKRRGIFDPALETR